MSWFIRFLNSSIGQKFIMAITGLFLCSFLVIHLIGNCQLFKDDQGLAFNIYAVFMTSNPLIKTISYVLYFAILYHAFKGLALAFANQKARPKGYAVKPGSQTSAWSSRNMGILGTIVLVFIVVHMSGFWFEYKFGHVPYMQYYVNTESGSISSTQYAGTVHNKLQDYMAGPQLRIVIVKDLYKEVALAFKEPLLVFFYVLAMAALSFHLVHGFKSAFQSLGLNHRKYNGLIRFVGVYIFGILIPVLFAAMPLYFFFKA